jgi:hypothetical protein
VPLAEIKTAGVIMAVNTASDEVSASIRVVFILTIRPVEANFEVWRLHIKVLRGQRTPKNFVIFCAALTL